MEWVSLLTEGRMPLGVSVEWAGVEMVCPYWVGKTAQPDCTNMVVTFAMQIVNDAIGDSARQRMISLIPLITRARRTDSDSQLNYDLLVKLVEYVASKYSLDGLSDVLRDMELIKLGLLDPFKSDDIYGSNKGVGYHLSMMLENEGKSIGNVRSLLFSLEMMIEDVSRTQGLNEDQELLELAEMVLQLHEKTLAEHGKIDTEYGVDDETLAEIDALIEELDSEAAV